MTQNPLTAEGTLVGTFQYMSPEQLEGREADARSDLFALGCVLYEMATGKRAFDGKSTASVVASIMNSDPAPLTQYAPLSPPSLEWAIRRCMAKDPEDVGRTPGILRATGGFRREDRAGVAVPSTVRSRRKILRWAAVAAALILERRGTFLKRSPVSRC